MTQRNIVINLNKCENLYGAKLKDRKIIKTIPPKKFIQDQNQIEQLCLTKIINSY